jgi:beta-mannosidase
MMFDLSSLHWSLTGWRPWDWKLRPPCGALRPDVLPVPARVPGSVQAALLAARVIKDWNQGLHSRDCEWIEHRHWEFSTQLPDELCEEDGRLFLCAEGLDYSGWIFVDDAEVGRFSGAMVPHRIELPRLPKSGPRTLSIIFDTPPPEQGQVGWTSESRYFKPRYNYGWDWCPRLVPIGISDAITVCSESEMAVEFRGITTLLEADNVTGTAEVALHVNGGLEFAIGSIATAVLFNNDREVARADAELGPGDNGLSLRAAVEAWWPNGMGTQRLYYLSITVRNASEAILFETTRKIGFKRVEWRQCDGAPDGAEPWICVVNGRPLFLQGVNWTPARLVYHDTTAADYERLIRLYRDMGCNLLRVWGGAFLERESFYQQCDEAGLLVWQEFPLSSSGLDNWPPHNPAAIAELQRIATSMCRRRRTHVSLLMWCGGNELQGGLDGSKVGIGKPVDISDPCLAALQDVVAREDPTRRYIPTSSSGPRFMADPDCFGQGLHHDVHGPWNFDRGCESPEKWREYWRNDDAFFRSEAGMPGATTVELIRKYAGGEALWPPESPLWFHASRWWIQWEHWKDSLAELAPETALCRYVEETRRNQAESLGIAAAACKSRFPRCGGFLIWMGHDCFPTLINSSIIDFDRETKPAYDALRRVFTTSEPPCP